jgi:hypothetical protein
MGNKQTTAGRVWTQETETAITNFTLQNTGAGVLFFAPCVDGVAPLAGTAVFRLEPGAALFGVFNDIFHGFGIADRLTFRSTAGTTFSLSWF